MTSSSFTIKLFFLLAMACCCAQVKNDPPRFFDLNVNKLDIYEYQVAVKLMLKMKAKKLLRSADTTSQKLYEICSRDAKIIPELARCVVNLMDRHHTSIEVDFQNEDNPIVMFIRSVRRDWSNSNWRAKRAINGGSEPTVDNSGSRERYRTDSRISPYSSYARLVERRRFLKKQKETEQVIEAKKVQEEADTKELPETFQKLNKIKSYLKKAEYCQNFMNEMARRSSRFIRGINQTVTFENQPPSTLSAVERIVNVFANSQSFKKLSILSPRLFGLFPKEKSTGPQFLSPDLLSFHDKGLFSIPSIFQNLSVDSGEMYQWIDLLMKITGASRQIDEIFDKSKDDIDFIETKAYPKIVEFEERLKQFEEVRKSYSEDQRDQLETDGYTFTTPFQSKVLFGKTSEYDFYTPNQREKLLEDKIRELARRTPNRVKRQESPDTEHHGPQLVVLEPWAFEHREGAVALEGIILSPHAFAGDFVSPEFFTMHLLSPSAFFYSLLSPLVLFTRILSPSAFRAEILSPEVLDAYILNPEAILAEILSPKFLDLRIASPRALSFEVLNPIILSPRVASPEHLAFRVLSPSILSPHIASDGHLNVEILSPHLLSGHGAPGHDTEESHHFSPEHHHEHGDNAFDHLFGA
ncbi:unnamed protein product [Bursaphelenchus xylophilus]|uniref:(pine wood nematode) hypothetical protein n=1 Tax=Bursaphelenchus xylophilus TaxID=6326 RepID=A0A1I7RIT0_BURXY|nr:unnamed protein product [Bursaphelenchus xylophilus]CAG9119070.1 unnamed protein product [Bursaphelenchus xylophilus]